MCFDAIQVRLPPAEMTGIDGALGQFGVGIDTDGWQRWFGVQQRAPKPKFLNALHVLHGEACIQGNDLIVRAFVIIVEATVTTAHVLLSSSGQTSCNVAP